jgi:hypothetical protein
MAVRSQVKKSQNTPTSTAKNSAVKITSEPLPDWWQVALRSHPVKTFKCPAWLKPADLLPLEHYPFLTETELFQILAALKASRFDQPHGLVVAFKQQINAQTVAHFAWALFWQWHNGDGEGKDSWIMAALGLWGNDATVFELTPLLREMPSIGLYKRAGLGLDCLQAIGSDIALMQINTIAQKIKHQSLRKKAEHCMNAIGAARQLTREQLEDRIVPDCGFSVQAKQLARRIFDYGDRTFEVILNEELQLIIKDQSDKILRSLPKAKAADDVQKVEAAIADWKLLKRQLSAVVKTQKQRLERAMVQLRRWSIEEFEQILLQHPILGQLARQLIWVGYGKAGYQTFRVTEDWTYADVMDEPVTVASMTSVGVAHPAQLSEVERNQWGELLSDYGIIAPFRQLTRRLFELEAEEKEGMKIGRFKGTKIGSMMAASILQKKGWAGGYDRQMNLFCHYHSMSFEAMTTAVTTDEAVQIIAVVSHDSDFYRDYETKLGEVWFVAGDDWRSPPMPLSEVSPVTISEVLRLVGAIAATSKEAVN